MASEIFRNTKQLVGNFELDNPENFEKDCEYFLCQLNENFDWFQHLDIFRKIAILALTFILGWKNFVSLPGIISLLADKNFADAAIEVAAKGYPYIADVLKNGEIKFAETK